MKHDCFFCLIMYRSYTLSSGKITLFHLLPFPKSRLTHKKSQKCKYLKIGKIAKNAKIPCRDENLAFYAILPILWYWHFWDWKKWLNIFSWLIKFLQNGHILKKTLDFHNSYQHSKTQTKMDGNLLIQQMVVSKLLSSKLFFVGDLHVHDHI